MTVHGGIAPAIAADVRRGERLEWWTLFWMSSVIRLMWLDDGRQPCDEIGGDRRFSEPGARDRLPPRRDGNAAIRTGAFLWLSAGQQPGLS